MTRAHLGKRGKFSVKGVKLTVKRRSGCHAYLIICKKTGKQWLA
jgi:hypothetical protein